MFASHPLDRVSTRTLWMLFCGSLGVSAAMSALFIRWGEVLIHNQAPHGILSFEFMWSAAGVAQVMGPWSDEVRRAMLHINIVDFAYLIAYGTLLATAAVLIRRRAQKLGLTQLAKLGLMVAWFAWFAAGFDAVENLASLPILIGNVAMPWAFIMSSAAGIKFLILLDILLYVIFISFFLLISGKRPS